MVPSAVYRAAVRLPEHRAFLIRLSDETDHALHRPIGRVEHVETGLWGSFSSLEELWDFVVSVLASEATVEDEAPGASPHE